MATSFRTPLSSKNLPITNLLARKSKVSKGIVGACDKFGFFKVISHGIPMTLLEKLNKQDLVFLLNQCLQSNKLAWLILLVMATKSQVPVEIWESLSIFYLVLTFHTLLRNPLPFLMIIHDSGVLYVFVQCDMHGKFAMVHVVEYFCWLLYLFCWLFNFYFVKILLLFFVTR